MAQEQKIMLPPDVNTQQLMMILNHVYPVGSYYETSDVNFDPNDSFVGEWSLEESGRVHVSAGTGYTIGSKGGSTEVPYHTHTLTRSTNVGVTVAAHDITQPSFTMKWTGDASSALSGSNPSASGNVMRRPGTNESTLTMKRATREELTKNHSVTVTQPVFTCAYAGTSGHNNMQPYIVVNRWHRDR